MYLLKGYNIKMKKEFLFTIALMGLSDYLYHGKKQKWIYNWMNEQEQTVYNLGWVYAKNNVE
jgi:hypothetical protein